MADIRLIWNAEGGYADWEVGEGDLVSGNTLETAVIRSLFTDKRAPADAKLPYPSADPRGCWTDSYTGVQIGSLLWLLDRAVKTDETTLLRQAETYATDALTWLITEGVVATVTATAIWATPTTIALSVVLTEPSGNVNRYRYSWAWNGG